jgi:hypothetical protein
LDNAHSPQATDPQLQVTPNHIDPSIVTPVQNQNLISELSQIANDLFPSQHVEGPSTETEIPDDFTTQNHEDGYVDSQESVTRQENNTPSVRTAEPQPIGNVLT